MTFLLFRLVQLLGPLLAALDTREQVIFQGRFASGDDPRSSLEELATRLDLFPDTPGTFRSPFWTSTPHVAPDQQFAIAFEDGSVTYNGDVTKPAFARCVRSLAPVAPPAVAFEVTSGAVRDLRTGLTWERAPTGGPYPTAQGALDYCAALTLDGRTWRLPTVKELNTLVDETRADPAIDVEAFPGTQANWYWTSTPFAILAGYHWGVAFDGGASYFNTSETGYARCVQQL